MVVSEHLEELPAGVLAAFGVAGTVPVRLAGGRGTTWRAGQVVLKPADSVREGRWAADVYDALEGPGFRVPAPVRAVTGDWVAQGWTAWRWVAGAAADWSGVSPKWPELIAVSRALQAAPQKAWSGKSENVAAGQQAFSHRAHMNGLASIGRWTADLEKKAA